MNVFAGLKLYGKNPKTAPAKTALIIIASKLAEVDINIINKDVDAIAVIAPQYFDHGLKGTLKMLARLAGKKVLFIELDEICKLIAMNENVQVI